MMTKVALHIWNTSSGRPLLHLFKFAWKLFLNYIAVVYMVVATDSKKTQKNAQKFFLQRKTLEIQLKTQKNRN
jgi:hypothetical protein